MTRRIQRPEPMSKAEQARYPKYTIGVVCQMLNLHPHTVRRFEEAGLLEPAREGGKNRFYSDDDLTVLTEIMELSEQGINHAGIRYILHMRKEVTLLQRQVAEARTALNKIGGKGE